MPRRDNEPLDIVRRQAGMAKETRYYPSSPGRLADACRQAFRACGFKLYEDGLPGGGLRGHVSASLTTWGESIYVTFDTLDVRAETTAVTCEAVPDSLLWSRDKSPEDLRAFFEALEQALA